MTFVKTDLGDTRESARRIRVEEDAFPLLSTNVQTSLQQLAGAVGNTKHQRSVTASPVVVAANDVILNVNLAGAGTCSLPLASSRNNVPITFKMLPGSATLTITRSGSDTFDGLTTTNLVGAQTLTLVPYNDGVNTGYAIE